jgi:hypothetical protein
LSDEPPTVGEALAAALAGALVKRGVLDADDIADAAARLDREGGEVNETAAHVLRCTVAEAGESEFAAKQARANLTVIRGEKE